MSVATEFAPTVFIPARARATSAAPAFRAEPLPAGPVPLRPVQWAEPAPAAPVAVLRPPALERPGLRLTQRGVVVLALAVALLGLALVWVARLSAPAPNAPRVAPHVVTVRAGDTLWSIATRVAPDADPQAEVDRLVRVNHLGGVDLVPGQQVRVP